MVAVLFFIITFLFPEVFFAWLLITRFDFEADDKSLNTAKVF